MFFSDSLNNLLFWNSCTSVFFLVMVEFFLIYYKTTNRVSLNICLVSFCLYTLSSTVYRTVRKKFTTIISSINNNGYYGYTNNNRYVTY